MSMIQHIPHLLHKVHSLFCCYDTCQNIRYNNFRMFEK
jgi:hypothetical protein